MIKDILKIVKSLENSGLLLEGVSETIKNKCIIKMNLDLMGFILEIICLIK